MKNYIFTVILVLLNLQTASLARVSELEMCQKNLQKVVTIVQNLVSDANTISPEKYLWFKPKNCADLLHMGNTESAVYTIYPITLRDTPNDALSVYCDMTTDGGGWIVLQRRGDFKPYQNFFQTWDAYKQGFGELEKEFWLGNENLHVLSNQENVSLRIDLADFEGATRYAKYDDFKISSCEDRYRLFIGSYDGNAGDSLTFHANSTFVTRDNGDVAKCAIVLKGGWWYAHCYQSNLNGLYLRGSTTNIEGVTWRAFKGDKYSLKTSEIKIRPSDFKKLE